MVGIVTSQGDRILRAQMARRKFRLDGRGVKVGVISDSFNVKQGAATNVRSGDLPGRGNPFGYQRPIRVLRDRRNGSDEGRAMLQVITDLAPGAELLFHTAYAPNQGLITQQSFAQAVKALVKAGADIIVDDVGFAAPLFQDGLAAQTVTQVAQQGILYFSAIGNDSNRSYRSIFRPSSQFVFQDQVYEAHDFDPEAGVDLFQDITLPFGTQIAPLLGWDQPIGQINQTFKLFLLAQPQLPAQLPDSKMSLPGDVTAANLIKLSTPIWEGENEQALEQLVYASNNRQTVYLVVASTTPIEQSDRPSQFQWISTANDGDRNVLYEYVNVPGEPEAATIYGHPNAKGAIAIGAVRFPGGSRFDRQLPRLAEFSSRGGTPILFDAAGDRLSTPEIRLKPELVAPDLVATTFDPFRPFAGTSAAVPHAAGVAALMLQRLGRTTAAQISPQTITQILQQTATPIDPPGNFRTGAGLIDASRAVLHGFQSQQVGTAGSDRLQGNPAANNLWGGAGHDRLQGGRGFDALWGERDADSLRGDRGNDYLHGGLGNDRLDGNRGHDSLHGKAGRDWLVGGRGDDRLLGGSGINHLKGGTGRDRFVLDRNGVAVIQDFRQQQDRLQLTDRLQFKQLQLIQSDTPSPELVIQTGKITLARLTNFSGILTTADFYIDSGFD
ncbi:MAG: S8 family serine peptidase [Elainella sp. Prado103]|nr:S8 family serine peptidase [Elainella sp. Prado103]